MRTFKGADVATLTGVDLNKLRVWRHRGLISVKRSNGHPEYTLNDLLVIRLIARLIALGQRVERAADIAARADLGIYCDPDEKRTPQTLLVIASDEVVEEEVDPIGMPRFETIDGGDDPDQPVVQLCEIAPETGKPRPYGWAFGTTDAAFVNLTDMEARLMKRIAELDEAAGSDD